MHRTQIQLEEWQYELLVQEAESEGTSLAHLVREAVSEYLEGRRGSGRGRDLSSIAGIAEDVEVTGADHDRFLYDRSPQPRARHGDEDDDEGDRGR